MTHPDKHIKTLRRRLEWLNGKQGSFDKAEYAALLYVIDIAESHILREKTILKAQRMGVQNGVNNHVQG